MKLNDILVSQKQRRKSSKNNRRFYTSMDMSIFKQDEAMYNSMEKRGIRPRTNNRGVCVCGCGAEGCFIHYSR
jgi:hypothetical protein